jgi:hypothetical protein
VPFADTAGHDLSAAACILPGQLPEALVVRNCFLDENAVNEFDALIHRARRQAKASGMKRSDIAKAVAKVRGRKWGTGK